MNRLIPITLALLLAGCGDSPEARLARAEKAYAAHDYRAAQVDLAAALQAQPGNARALDLAARSHIAQGDGVAAQAALDKLGAHAPADFALLEGEAALLRGKAKAALEAVDGLETAEALRIRALGRLMLGDIAAASQSFADGAKARGDKARLLADFSRFELGRGNRAAAARLAAQALKAAPGTLDPLLASAQLAVADGDLAHALDLYDRAARAYPGNLAALTGKAATLGDLGRAKEMAALLGQLRESADNSPAVAYLDARAAAGRNDWTRVRAVLQPLEAELGARDDAMLLYAQAQLRLGQAEQARARLEPLHRRAPAHALTAMLLAEAQLAGGDPAGAAATLAPLASKPEAAPEVLALMAKATRAAGDPGSSRYARRARYPSPEALGSELAKGDAALKKADWKAAAAAYERILAITDGKNALVLNNLAYAQGQLGNHAKALTYALRALKLDPDNPSVMDTAGWLLVETGGDRNRALDLLRAAARKAPGNATIRGHLQAAEAKG
ncbi:MAG TPA: tetratricopeptide repeat protein [Novosphingobium sp.]|nr:tetratricopeptide repeat protein [Novosphingobium sp.]